MAQVSRRHGVGRIIIVIYVVLALAATGRSFFQLVTKFDQAPLAYTLSAVSAVVYILATIALLAPGKFWYRTAQITIVFELVGVIVIGLLSVVVPDIFAYPTVWSYFGMGYLFIPLVMPVVGLVWLHKHPEEVS